MRVRVIFCLLSCGWVSTVPVRCLPVRVVFVRTSSYFVQTHVRMKLCNNLCVCLRVCLQTYVLGVLHMLAHCWVLACAPVSLYASVRACVFNFYVCSCVYCVWGLDVLCMEACLCLSIHECSRTIDSLRTTSMKRALGPSPGWLRTCGRPRLSPVSTLARCACTVGEHPFAHRTLTNNSSQYNASHPFAERYQRVYRSTCSENTGSCSPLQPRVNVPLSWRQT